MSSAVLTIPDDPAAVPGWLERRLLAPDLHRLVAELEAVHGPPPAPPRLDDVLGGHAPAVLADGLGRLPRPALSLLLRHPALLPELRDRVLVEGGAYWDRYLGDDLTAAGEQVADGVRAALRAAEPAPARRRPARWVGYAVTALATAAAALLGVYLAGWRPPPRQPGVQPGPETAAAAGWGFQKVRQLPRDATDAQTLSALADLASEWGKKRPETADELARRLVEFREGCAAIRLADGLPLSVPQRRWLDLRCGDWAAAIDHHLRTLEETRDVAAVRAAADRTTADIVRELRGRAAALGKG